MTQITIEDYQRLLDMCLMMDNYEDQYRLKTLKILSGCLGPGFHHLTFLTLDNFGRLGNPVGINKVQSLCDSYDQLYGHFDIFRRVCISETAVAGVKSIEDIMSLSEYERTTYYNDFLRKENLYYELAVPLCYDNRLVGGLGIFRERKEGNFTPREKEIVGLISRHLALSYHNSLKVEELQSVQGLSIRTNEKENLLFKLTATEREIVYLVEHGMTNQAIAKEKNISFHTVKAHLEHIYDKLDVHCRTEMLHRINQKQQNQF